MFPVGNFLGWGVGVGGSYYSKYILSICVRMPWVILGMGIVWVDFNLIGGGNVKHQCRRLKGKGAT